MTDKCHESTSSKSFDIYVPTIGIGKCFDERKFSRAGNVQEFPSTQSKNRSPDERELSSACLSNNADRIYLVFRPYGCGICNDMFEIENEFIEHCHNHCSTPKKETFVDLCEGHLSTRYRVP